MPHARNATEAAARTLSPLRDPIADAIHAHANSLAGVADALQMLASEVRAATAQRRPVDEFYAGATLRLDRLCQWLKVKGPWLLACAPVTLVAVQAISPEAGKALASILQELAS